MAKKNLDPQYLAALVRATQAGDSNAFAELYLTTYPDIYRFSYDYLQNEFLAQDALQKTYVQVLKSIQTIRDGNVILSWIQQVNFRICFNIRKKAGDGASPEMKIVRIDQDEYLVRQILDLPSSEARALLLFYYENMTLDQIAKLMDCKSSSVGEYIDSGKERLKNLHFRNETGSL